MAQGSIRNQQAVLEALREACARKEALILVTPYLHVTSHFLRLEAQCVHVAITMSHEEATYGLRNADLRLRFPYRTSFLEGRVTLLGFGRVDERPTLRLSIPEALAEGDQRGAYRVEHVGRVDVTLSTRNYDLIGGTLVNISTTGVRIHSSKAFEEGEVLKDDAIAITVPLTDEIRFDAKARVRYVQDREVGMEFVPRLKDPLLRVLSRWVFHKREEDLKREANRVAAEEIVRASAEFHSGGLVLVSTDAELEDRLRELLQGLPTLTRLAPTVQALKSIGGGELCLVLFHVASLGLDERRRVKALTEGLSGRIPFLLLGTDLEPSVLFELGNEVKAESVYVLGPKPSSLFRRMVEGLLRKYGKPASEG
jgi:hypothetical protein